MDAIEAGEKWQRDEATRINSALRKGHEEGLQQDIEKVRIQIARMMLKEKIEPTTISTVTGLSLGRIGELLGLGVANSGRLPPKKR